MGVNNNTLKQQTAVITPLRIVNTKQSVDSSVNSVDDTARKATAPLGSAGTVVATKEKDTKKSDDLQQTVSKLNDYVQTIQRNLQFNIDKESGVMVVKVIDTKSAKVIRQIPNEETLRMARSLVEHGNEEVFNIFSHRSFNFTPSS